jgi:hypothetical protein
MAALSRSSLARRALACGAMAGAVGIGVTSWATLFW